MTPELLIDLDALLVKPIVSTHWKSHRATLRSLGLCPVIVAHLILLEAAPAPTLKMDSGGWNGLSRGLMFRAMVVLV